MESILRVFIFPSVYIITAWGFVVNEGVTHFTWRFEVIWRQVFEVMLPRNFILLYSRPVDDALSMTTLIPFKISLPVPDIKNMEPMKEEKM